MQLTSTEPFENYKIYTAVKLHFEGNYDYFKYNGKTSVSSNAFFKRRDKYFFAKLSRKYDREELKFFYASNFAHNGTKWIGELGEESADITYKNYKKFISSFTYQFKTYINSLTSEIEFADLFKIEDGQYPLLLHKLMQREIPLEVFVILNRYIGFILKFDRMIVDPIMWPTISRTIKKYDPFVQIDDKKGKSILVDALKGG